MKALGLIFYKPQRILMPFVIASVIALGFSTEAQTLYRWDFDTAVTGTTVAPSIATGGGGGLTMTTLGNQATDLYGSPGSGVSGNSGDRAFANATAVTSGGLGGLAMSTVGDMNLGVLSRFTMIGWIRADGGFSSHVGFPRIFMIGPSVPEFGAANTAAISISPFGAATLQLRLSNIFGPDGPNGALSATGSLIPFGSDWTFFAVSVDLTTAANNVNFYLGNASSLNSAFTVSYNNAGTAMGSINFGATASAALLNRNIYNRSFDGWGDDFRFSNGALDGAAIEAIRIAAIPEPHVIAIFGSAVAALSVLRRRLRRETMDPHI